MVRLTNFFWSKKFKKLEKKKVTKGATHFTNWLGLGHWGGCLTLRYLLYMCLPIDTPRNHYFILSSHSRNFNSTSTAFSPVLELGWSNIYIGHNRVRVVLERWAGLVKKLNWGARLLCLVSEQMSPQSSCSTKWFFTFITRVRLLSRCES